MSESDERLCGVTGHSTSLKGVGDIWLRITDTVDIHPVLAAGMEDL